MADADKLSHFDEAGQARMVDVSAKETTRRTATASAFVELSAAVLAALPANPDVFPAAAVLAHKVLLLGLKSIWMPVSTLKND